MESLNVNAKNWKALIKPAQLDVKISDDKSHAKIIAEPLEKGYGLTLGNSLRRILLSSIRETALRALQAKGFKILSIKDTTPMPHNGVRQIGRAHV